VRATLWKYGPAEAIKFVTVFLTFFSFIGGSAVTCRRARVKISGA
jgi:hypothetical protein